MLSFQLTMPSCSSWNGQWSGDGHLFYKTRSYVGKQKEIDLNGKNFYYNFGDGWESNIKVEMITSQEGIKRRKKSGGFCGYDWMIDEILKHGRILQLSEKTSN